MGLDMYLEKMDKIGDYTINELMEFRSLMHDKEEDLPKDIQEAIFTEHRYGMEWRNLSTEIGYWRKANQIHNWFVKNVQNGEDKCNPHLVTKEKLQELLTCVTKVLALGDKVAEEIFPPSEGFFFGSTDYDEYYYEMMEHTKEVVEQALENTDFDKKFVFYQSSW